MQYGYSKRVLLPYEEAVEKIKSALGAQGFGVLTEIDVKATMKKKLGVEYEHYLILGACNPEFAHQALTEEKEIGLLLPCNVIVYESNAEVYVSTVLPSSAMSMVKNKKVAQIAKEVEERLKAAVEAV